MGYAQDQEEWIKANCVEVGDRVKVVKGMKHRESAKGWNCTWVSEMDRAVGNTYEILRILKNDGIVLKTDLVGGFWFPYFVLEKVGATTVPSI